MKKDLVLKIIFIYIYNQYFKFAPLFIIFKIKQNFISKINYRQNLSTKIKYHQNKNNNIMIKINNNYIHKQTGITLLIFMYSLRDTIKNQ